MYYCILPWGSGDFVKLQKGAVTRIYKESRLPHTDPIFPKMNLLKINDRAYISPPAFIFYFKNKLLRYIQS